MKKDINDVHESQETDYSSDSNLDSIPRKPVVPGEIIISGEDYLPGDGARRERENVVASRFGLAEISGRVVKVISLFGAFIPSLVKDKGCFKRFCQRLFSCEGGINNEKRRKIPQIRLELWKAEKLTKKY